MNYPLCIPPLSLARAVPHVHMKMKVTRTPWAPIFTRNVSHHTNANREQDNQWPGNPPVAILRPVAFEPVRKAKAARALRKPTDTNTVKLAGA